MSRIEVEDDDYVAWCRYTDHTIVTCDSDAEGAFRVCRHGAVVEMTKRYYECLKLMRRAERAFRREGWEGSETLEAVFDDIASYVSYAKLADELESEMDDREVAAEPPAVFNRPECPFHYCDQPAPYEACQAQCHHRTASV